MKRLLIIASVAVALVACAESSTKEGGSTDDGIHINDRDGALQDTGKPYTPATDTAIGEDRVDLQKRN